MLHPRYVSFCVHRVALNSNKSLKRTATYNVFQITSWLVSRMPVAVGWCKIGRIQAIRCVTWDSRSRTCGGHNSHGSFCVSDLLEKREALFATRLHTRWQRGRVHIRACRYVDMCGRTYIHAHICIGCSPKFLSLVCMYDGE